MPENTLNEVVEQIASGNLETAAQKSLARMAQIKFYEQKARKDSAFLARASQWISSAWEIIHLIATLKDGQVLVVDSEGNIRRGSLSSSRMEKMHLLPQKAPKRLPVNLDNAEVEYKSLVGKSYDEMSSIGTGFTHQWISAVKKAPKKKEYPLLNMFLDTVERISKEHPEKIHYDILQTNTGKTVTVSIDGFKTQITTNQFGRMISYKDPTGKIVEL